MPLVPSVSISVSSRSRLTRARQWLLGHQVDEQLVVVANSVEAAADVARRAMADRGVAFGWHRVSWWQLAHDVAAPGLAAAGLVPITRIASDAVVATLVHRLRTDGKLGRYEAVSTAPGFPRAIASVLEELRMAKITVGQLTAIAPDLAPFLEGYAGELARGGYCDRASVFDFARQAIETYTHPLIGLPTLFLDVAISTRVEIDFAAAVVKRAAASSQFLVPAADVATRDMLRAEFGAEPADLDSAAPSRDLGPLARLQHNLFRGTASADVLSGDDVSVFSAPGEGRESVEIVRRILALAQSGTRFDEMAVLLRSPQDYRPHLEEAFSRAGIPVCFARGANRPDPSGRAFVALLKCAAENLSALRFAEYLSLGEVPDAATDGAPPQARDRDELWVPSDTEEETSEPQAAELAELNPEPGATINDEAPVLAGKLRAPRRWEKLLVEASVVGGSDRWHRRLNGLMNQLKLEAEDPNLEGAAVEALTREAANLKALADFALPIIEDLDRLPERAPWRDWLEQLATLATRTLRGPDRTLGLLAELAPMGDVGPIPLDQVLDVLEDLLLENSGPPTPSRYGKVFVAPIEAARGLSFGVVFLPGLAEKKFPRRIVEEPLLLDEARARLDGALSTNQTKLEAERLALATAVDAAGERLYLSYSRIDLENSRSRVPSFYALEVVRAAEGLLPDFAELTRRAEQDAASRLGWPAPSDPREAIDDTEYDLAVLAGLMDEGDTGAAGRARYLLNTNVHLARALRQRFLRWKRSWTEADGLLRTGPAARAGLDRHLPQARSYSPTALQTFAACPYKFLLKAIHGLAPREVASSLDELDPLQRGSLIHEVHFGLYVRLRDLGLLPVRPNNLQRAQALLEDVLVAVGGEYRDVLAPAIERVWEDELAAIRTDLREWLRLSSIDPSGYVPIHFELAFGLGQGRHGRRASDPRSTTDPVRLDSGLLLRGSIDVVERHPSRLLRITDHKTGKADFTEGQIIKGGRSLQPILYALAAEKLLGGDDEIVGGRLYFSTSRGGFAEATVELSEEARLAANELTETITSAISKPFLPAAPAADECDRCEYRIVCGPYEEIRVARKPPDWLDPLIRLRETK